MAVRDSGGHWWSKDLRYSWDGHQWLQNRPTLEEVPLTAEFAHVIRGVCGIRMAIGLTGAVLAVIPGVMLAASGDVLRYVIAAFFAALTLAGVAIAVFTWYYAHRDMSQGGLVKAAGSFIVWHRAISGDLGATNWSEIVLPYASLPIKNEVAVLLRQHACLVRRAATFMVPRNDLLLFDGGIEYAPRTGLALRIYDACGCVIWQHPGPIWEFTRLPLW